MRRMSPRLLLACAAVALLVVVNGCSGGGTEPARVATTVIVTPGSWSFTALGATEQFTAVVKDQNGDTLVNAPVAWSSDNAAVSVNASSGLATAVANGAAQITATSGAVNQSVGVTVAQAVASIAKVSGDLQTGTVAQALAQPVLVAVKDANNNAIAGLRVNFTVAQGGGQVSAAADTTDAGGQAQVSWTLGQAAGTAHQVSAALAQGGPAALTFSATAVAGPPALVNVVSGNNQAGVPSAVLPSPIVVSVTDQFTNIKAGVTVNFTVTAGGGSANPPSPVTGANGQTQTTWTLGAAAGTQTLQASAAGVVGVQVNVNATASNLSVTAVSPNPIIEGQSATITGTGFSATPASNTVTIAGVAATVTAASTTQLTVTVPALNCQPARSDTIQVTVAAVPSNKFVHPRRPASFLGLAVGQQLIVKNPTDLCLQFDRVAAAETYLIGVQSTSEVASTLTPVTVTSVVAPGGAPAPPALAFVTPPIAGGPTPRSLPTAMAERSERWGRHRQAEMGLRDLERRTFGSRFVPARQRGGPVALGLQQQVPPVVNVGDSINVRYPDIVGGNLCNFIELRTVARAVGSRGVWLEDAANPINGYVTADFTALSAQLDNPIFDTDTSYFGSPGDIDGNGRIVVVVTKEVNKSAGLLGFVTNADLASPASCASSNQGELFYAKAPDPTAQFGAAYTATSARADAPFLVAHEFSHIIQFSRRSALGAPNMASWTAEGQATLAEEVAGHAVEARTTGSNLGFAVAFNTDDPSSIDWYSDRFGDLAVYYGFQSSTTRNAGAPEECTFLQNLGPCVLSGSGTTYSRLIYGVSWSILRWMSDQLGPTFPGGEKGLQKAITSSTSVGYANLATASGIPIDTILAQWAATLFVDDRMVAAAARLTMPSWNLVNIEGGLVASARLTPRDRPYDNFTDNINVRAGSNGYFRVTAATHAATAVRARTPADAALPSTMQVWVVRMQ